MKGIYEQQWQDALAGVSVQPSEGLWEKIADDLDSDHGRHNWVTILLIAATVTVAFAFPLTIGNSSFEIRDRLTPDIAQDTQNNLNEFSNESNANIVGLVPEDDQEGISVKDNISQNTTTNTNIVNNRTALPTETDDKPASLANIDQYKAVKEPTGLQATVVSSSRAQGYGMEKFDLGYSLAIADINDHYFIPYYLPAKSVDRSLLASLNLGTGSLKAGNGFGGLGLLNADAAQSSLDGNSTLPDERSENSGSTVYFSAGVELPIGKRWSLLAGLGYLAQNANGTSNVILEQGNVSRPLGAYDPIGPGTVFLAESYSYSVTNSYINVPLTVKYPFINRKIKLRGGVGVSTDFMISHTIDSDAYGRANYKPGSMDYNTVVLAGLINLDITYSVSNDYSIALEGGLRKGFTAIDKNKGYYPSSFTVGLILFYKIH